MDEIREEISRVARDLFIKSGCQEGHDLENWLTAEEIVLSWHQPYDEREKHVGEHDQPKEAWIQLDPDEVIN